MEILDRNGFKRLSESKSWDLKVGGKYYFTRNHSTILAFGVGGQYVSDNFNHRDL